MRAFFVLPLLLPLTASAGSIPLAEFEWSQAFDVTLPAPYSVFAERGGGSTPRVTAGYFVEAVDQFPHSSMLDAATVEAFDRVLAHDPAGLTAWIRFWNGGIQGEHAVEPNQAGCATCFVDRLIGSEREEWLDRATAEGWQTEMFVPAKGPALWGYAITDIERTITADSQTITLHGVSVPEPAAWLLAIIAGVVRIRFRK